MFIRTVAVSLVLAAPVAMASSFPDHAITLIVPFSAGGPTDVVARHLAKAMEKDLKQTIVVENRPSAGGLVGIEKLLRSAADGYTLLIHNIGMSTVKSINPQLQFDPQKDFSYVGEIADVPMTLVGKRALPPKDFGSLRSYLQEHGKSINISNAGIGTASHLCALMLMSKLRLDMTMIPYKGAAPALTDLQGGQVDLLCDQITTTLSPIQAKRVQSYGTTSLNRLDSLPELPTLSEQGLKNFEINVWHGIYAPKGTPEPAISRLSEALQAALADKQFSDSMSKLGAVPVSTDRATPASLRQHLHSQISLWSPLIEQSSIYLK
ncbi:tripartite tricarboxylate transporter substrate-binding protein [Advenella kashmirensis]